VSLTIFVDFVGIEVHSFVAAIMFHPLPEAGAGDIFPGMGNFSMNSSNSFLRTRVELGLLSPVGNPEESQENAASAQCSESFPIICRK
jgi:hypothetical protein